MNPQAYQELKDRYARFDTWRGDRTSYHPSEVPADLKPLTNDEISALEVYEFKRDKPTPYFLYISDEKRVATTWTGEVLGTVTFGREYQSPGFGRCSTRVPVRIKAVNGVTYAGTYYKSSGDYARVKAVKS